ILYECLTARPPFKASTPCETLLQVVSQEPVPLRQLQPGVSPDLETICHKCLQKEPGKRYPSAAELADDLRRYLEGRPIVARPVGRGERLWRWCRREPALAGLLAALFVAVAAGTTASWSLAARAMENARLAREEAARADDEAREARRNEEKAEVERRAALA